MRIRRPAGQGNRGAAGQGHRGIYPGAWRAMQHADEQRAGLKSLLLEPFCELVLASERRPLGRRQAVAFELRSAGSRRRTTVRVELSNRL